MNKIWFHSSNFLYSVLSYSLNQWLIPTYLLLQVEEIIQGKGAREYTFPHILKTATNPSSIFSLKAQKRVNEYLKNRMIKNLFRSDSCVLAVLSTGKQRVKAEYRPPAYLPKRSLKLKLKQIKANWITVNKRLLNKTFARRTNHNSFHNLDEVMNQDL